MNSLTFTEAYALLEKATTKEEIRQVIARIDVGESGGISVLFSGRHEINTGKDMRYIGTLDIANALAEDATGLRVMGNTDMGRFMNIDSSRPDANSALISALERVFEGNGDEINNFLYGSYENGILIEPGLWDDASARFVRYAKGDVLTLTGDAKIDRIFARTELPILLENTNVKTIDGIPRELLAALPKTNGVPVEAFEAIRTMSALRTAGLGIAIDVDGKPILEANQFKVDARKFLAGMEGVAIKAFDSALSFQVLETLYPPGKIAEYSKGLEVLQKLQINIAKAIDDPSGSMNRSLLSRFIASLGDITDTLDMLSITMVAWQAAIEYQRGDREAGDSLLSNWALENGGALLGGHLGAVLGTALFGVSTGGLGLLAGLGAGLLGSYLGGQFGDDIFRLLVNGIADLHDHTLSQLRGRFGQLEQYTSPLVMDLDRNGIDTLSLTDGRRYFDHDGNRFAERTGWVDPRDGLLVRDLNQNGFIDSGQELFGNQTLLPNGRRASHGFEALASLDQDGNGIINAHDEGWRSLAIWIDNNSSGVVDLHELHSLESRKIMAISLHFENRTFYDQQG
ncbi:MAG: hypothetical protein VKK97_11275, partial [Synechococcaceae cyanobacterium]|nr:hypothetical protein [Synechococcaceae cyanobacterium]